MVNYITYNKKVNGYMAKLLIKSEFMLNKYIYMFVKNCHRTMKIQNKLLSMFCSQFRQFSRTRNCLPLLFHCIIVLVLVFDFFYLLRFFFILSLLFVCLSYFRGFRVIVHSFGVCLFRVGLRIGHLFGRLWNILGLCFRILGENIILIGWSRYLHLIRSNSFADLIRRFPWNLNLGSLMIEVN